MNRVRELLASVTGTERTVLAVVVIVALLALALVLLARGEGLGEFWAFLGE